METSSKKLMSKKRLYIIGFLERMFSMAFAVVMVSFMLSCSKNTTEPDMPQPDIPGYEAAAGSIGFGVSDDWIPMSKAMTKAQDVSDPSKVEFAQGDKIGVFGYYLGESGTVASTNPNFMYNQAVTRGAGDGVNAVWDYSPKKYWSKNPQDKFAFFAYYPHSSVYDAVLDPDISWSANNSNGAPTLTYTAPESSSGSKVDFLYAKVENTREGFSDDKVSFNFRHMLAKVQFKFEVAGGKTAYIKHIGFSIPKSGTFNFTEGGDPLLPQWNNVSGTKSVTFNISDTGIEVPVKDGETVLPVHNFTVFALPCTTLGKLTLRMSTDHYTYTTITTENPVNVDVVAGKVTTVTVTINPKGLSVTAVTQPWSEETYSPIFTPDKDQ